MNPQSCQCKFCSKPADHAPIAELEQHGITVFFCNDCMSEFTFWKSGSPMSESVYTTIGDRMYRWTFTPATGKGALWYIKTPGIPGTRTNENLKFIKGFSQDVPNITPSNFAEKLRTYLVFI